VGVGTADFALTVTGFNFLPGTAVCWNGVPLPTTFVSATQLTASVAASQLATSATVTITVVNPGSGGETSSGVTFAVYNPSPILTRIVPPLAPSGISGFQLTVIGLDFASNAQVRWNGAALATTYVSGDRLTARVEAANLVSAGSANVTVVNPSRSARRRPNPITSPVSAWT
jgi:hypothetical protein